ncbi:MAG: glycosyltransferase family 39 protein [Candidatus Omnitrophica bacterium]|nr:glycosyltransferase family 39 protein [Candidatus Omnitrophota bacterium]
MQEIYTLFIKKRKINIYFLFFLFCFLLYLPSVFFRAPFYPDEFRNIYIAKNIKTNFEFFFPNYIDEFYDQKPPFYFWILRFLLLPFKNFLFLPVFFNIIVSTLILSINYLFIKKELNKNSAFLSSLILSTTAIFYSMTILVRMDILFLLFILLSIYFFYLSLYEEKKIYILLAGFFSFLATFTKGAFGIIFPFFIQLTTSIILKNKKYFLKTLFINIFAFFLIFLWLFLFSFFKKDYFYILFFKQTILRGLNPQSHKQPFWYYFLYIVPLFLPWSFFLFGYFLKFKKNKFLLWEKIYLVWFVGGFLILSFVRSKLPMYLLLLSTPVAGLVAKFLNSEHKKLINNLFFFTIAFFIFSWIIGWIIFKDKGFMHQAIFSFFLFVIMLFTIFRKKIEAKIKFFFIFWIILLQLVNFIYIPIVSKSSTLFKIFLAVQNLNLKFDEIVVTDKKLKTIEILYFKKPIRYKTYIKDICLVDKPTILITEEINLNCNFLKIEKIKNFSIFYKK